MDAALDIALDWAIEHFYLVSVVMAIVIIIYVIFAENPNEPKTKEFQSLRFCRIGLVCFALSWIFGLSGLFFALIAFIMGIIGLVKSWSSINYTVFLTSASLMSAFFCLLLGDSRPL